VYIPMYISLFMLNVCICIRIFLYCIVYVLVCVVHVRICMCMYLHIYKLCILYNFSNFDKT
jgi:hypothetical protein